MPVIQKFPFAVKLRVMGDQIISSIEPAAVKKTSPVYFLVQVWDQGHIL